MSYEYWGTERLNDPADGLPSAEDLDAVAEEQRIADERSTTLYVVTPQIIQELTYCSYRENRRLSPEVTPERWAALFGKREVEEMEARFQRERP